MARRKVSFIITAKNKGFIKALEQSQRRLSRFGRKMERMGRSMTRNITVPVGIAGGAAVKMAADFESSMSKIEGLVGLARDEVAGMRGDVLRLAGETSRAPQELADALFFVTSAGLRGAEAIEVLEASARAAAAGLGETKTVADLVTSAVNAYGIENLSAAKATDILTAAVREGKAEAPQLASSLGQVLPVASEMGVTFDQVGAAVAAMTRTGTDAQTAATQLRQILFKLLKPAAESEKAFRDMGTSGAELRRQLKEEGLISVLGFLKDQMEDNEQAMAQAFPRVQALAGALDIMGSNADENRAIFERMTDVTGTADKAFDAAAQTTEFKFNKALSNLKATGIELGATLLPIVNDIIKVVDDWVTGFSELDETTKQNLIRTTAFVAALGPMITVGGKAIKVVAGLNKAVAGLATALKTGTALIWGYVGAIAALGVANFKANQRGQDRIDAISEEVKKLDTYHKATVRIVELERERAKVQKQMAKGARGLEKKLEDLNQELRETIDWRDYLALQALEKASDEVKKNTDKIKESVQSVSGPSLSGISIGTSGGVGSPSAEAGAQFGLDTDIADAVNTGGLQRAESQFNSIAEAMRGVTEEAKIMGDALQTTVTNAVAGFAETLGNAFTGDAGASGFFKNILLIVVDFANRFGKLLVAAGVAAKSFKSLLANPVAAIVAGGALIALTTAIRNLLERGPEQSVSDALIRSDGSIVRLHPNDDVLAMQDFGNLQPAMSGSQVIRNELFLDGQTVWSNQRRVNTNKGR